jgi:hypothetical protein
MEPEELIVMLPETENVRAVLPLKSRIPATVRLAQFPFEFIFTSSPLEIVTLLVEDGTPEGDQIEGLFQLPLPVEITFCAWKKHTVNERVTRNKILFISIKRFSDRNCY